MDATVLSFPGQALLACEACQHVFIHWRDGPATCASCASARLRHIRWPERAPASAAKRAAASA